MDPQQVTIAADSRLDEMLAGARSSDGHCLAILLNYYLHHLIIHIYILQSQGFISMREWPTPFWVS